jgi:hypothetical protein
MRWLLIILFGSDACKLMILQEPVLAEFPNQELAARLGLTTIPPNAGGISGLNSKPENTLCEKSRLINSDVRNY